MVDGGREYLRYEWKPIEQGGKRPRIIRWCKRDGVYPNIKVKDRWPY